MELEKLGLWHEPIELSENLGTFFSDVRNLLLSKAAATPLPETLDDLALMLGNAISCLFGISVLSGNFEHIIQALETVHSFEKAVTSKELSDKVFEKCGNQLKHYLRQIQQVSDECESYHAMVGTNISAVYGIGK